jgi:putative DNA primase/helicase
MFVLSSINTALKQGADRNRFSLLMLRTPDTMTAKEKADHWQDLQAELVRHVTKETGKRLMARMINLIPVVREAAATFSRLAAIEYNSARMGEQVGTLLAGAWAITSQQAPTDEQALAVIRAAGWSPDDSRSDDGAGDQGDCLQTIIQTRLRVEVESKGQYSGRVEVVAVSRTVSELIEIVAGSGRPSEVVTPDAAETELGRHGLRVSDGFLIVSNTAKGVRAMLRDTQWAAGGWPNLLVSHKGAERRGVTRFRGLASATRAVAIPLSLLPQDVSAKTAPVTVAEA